MSELSVEKIPNRNCSAGVQGDAVRLPQREVSPQNPSEHVHRLMWLYQVEQIIDEERIYASMHEAVEAFQSQEWGEL